jgi:hypothetical protein
MLLAVHETGIKLRERADVCRAFIDPSMLDGSRVDRAVVRRTGAERWRVDAGGTAARVVHGVSRRRGLVEAHDRALHVVEDAVVIQIVPLLTLV